MKRFVLVAERDENGTDTLNLSNEGYSAVEIIGLLELKKQDIIQIMNERKGESHYVAEN